MRRWHLQIVVQHTLEGSKHWGVYNVRDLRILCAKYKRIVCAKFKEIVCAKYKGSVCAKYKMLRAQSANDFIYLFICLFLFSYNERDNTNQK